MIRGPAGRITQVPYVLPRHKAANWVGRGRKSTRPGANGLVELSPIEFLDRLAGITRRKSPARTTRHESPKAKLIARVGEEFPLECPACGGDIRLIALHQSPGRSERF